MLVWLVTISPGLLSPAPHYHYKAINQAFYILLDIVITVIHCRLHTKCLSHILWQNKWYQNSKTHACFPSKCVFFKNRGLQQLRISLQQNDDLAHNKRYIKKLEAAILCWEWFLDSLRLRFYGACLKSIQIHKTKSGFSSKHVISRSLTLKNIVDMLK